MLKTRAFRALAPFLLLFGLAVAAATPAGAVTYNGNACTLYGWQNPGGSGRIYYPAYWSATQPNPSGGNAASRYGCAVVGVVTQPDGHHYQFAARVQDLTDAAPYPNHQATDAGRIIPKYHLPAWGTGVFYAPVYDQTVDGTFNDSSFSTWYSPVYDDRVDGAPQATTWVVDFTTQYSYPSGGGQTWTAGTRSGNNPTWGVAFSVEG